MCELCAPQPHRRGFAWLQDLLRAVGLKTSKPQPSAGAKRTSWEAAQDRSSNELLLAAREAGWQQIGTGSFRYVFISPSGRYVYKVPLGSSGFRCNKREHELFRERDSWGTGGLKRDQYARCRLSPSGILVMELVKPYMNNLKRGSAEGTYEEPPDWASVLDTEQVGLNREGRWVAFDYGNE